MSPTLTAADAVAFADCIEAGGVAVFPADTVYGLACDPDDARAVARLYELKGRAPHKPAAVMWFDGERALAALPELGEGTRAVVERLMPGAVTLLLPNPHGRFPLAAGPGGDVRTLGVRVPRLTGTATALVRVRHAVLQSSANEAGGADARTLDAVPAAIRDGADLALDAGPLPGTPSTVVDLRDYDDTGEWAIVREGAVPTEDVARALGIVGRP
ncbi:MAG TPA: Sua5/YciO/YrdC/YwlC family protein [Conexibacter sp.]|jgi:L-threonylcarbamoyladenylate synthase|nr:Sua5/YciO/YrdC/YwlC family protein [Conexibacter sp.]